MAMEGGAAEWFRRRERQGLGLTNVEGGGGGGDEGGGAAAGESGTSLWALEDEESEALGWDSFGRVMGLSSSEDLRCNALESLRDNPTSGESPRIVLRVETLRRRPRKYEFILPKIFWRSLICQEKSSGVYQKSKLPEVSAVTESQSVREHHDIC